MARRFGPTRAAGVIVQEQDAQKSIVPAAMGAVGYSGIVEKGPVGKLILASTKAMFKRICGSYLSDSLLPDAAFHYYDLAAGAGGIAVVRVTDGNEQKSAITLYGRYGDLLTPMGQIRAHNGGRWGGTYRRYTNDMAVIGDLTNTTLDTGVTMVKDQWKGGYIELSAVSNKSYPIISNTTAGVVTVASDQTMLDDHGGGIDLRYYLGLNSGTKQLSVSIGDGEEKPNEEFSLLIFVDGVFVKKYPNLHTDPTNKRYWVSIINNDTANYEIEVVDSWTGLHVAATRPASIYGKVDAVTTTMLTSFIHDFTINSPTGGNPTMVLGTTNDTMLAQKITVTMSAPTTGTVASDRFGSLGGTLTLGAAYTPNNKYSPPFTVTAGATPLVSGDTLVINYKPYIADQLIGGYLYPDKPNAKLVKYRIVDNDHKRIIVADGSVMTDDSAPNDYYLVEAPIPLVGGIDGIADLMDADYIQQAYDTSSSPLNQLFGKNMGLVKLATPGVTSTLVQKAGVAYAEAKNYQYRYEFPSNVSTEAAAITYINDTIGRNDFSVAAFPTYCYVADPDGGSDGKLKLVTNVGMIHGREARIAGDYNGYHKAEAGSAATLPAILKLCTVDSVGDILFDEELLNPVGIAIIKKVGGNHVIWGDRIPYVDPGWSWKHQREQMSHYENTLRESFDWIIFAINDATTRSLAKSALDSFFMPEWQKRALRGETYGKACIIKIDAENNTTATMAAGEMNAEVSLRLADTVERFIITMSKQGIFDSVN